MKASGHGDVRLRACVLAELQACEAVRDELALKINVTLKPLFCGKPHSTLDVEYDAIHMTGS
ncbi:hypothetical protein J6590_090517 [Homalodisca vitripennis]|nr:hypothetical protein J6590_090517 [Homalodisca vitripennis]